MNAHPIALLSMILTLGASTSAQQPTDTAVQWVWYFIATPDVPFPYQGGTLGFRPPVERQPLPSTLAFVAEKSVINRFEVRVGIDGHVVLERTLNVSAPLIERRVNEVFRQWTFEPATLNGKPVAVKVFVALFPKSAEVHQGGMGPFRDLNDGYAAAPPELRNGTATLDQVKAWLARSGPGAFLPGQPDWSVSEQDLDQDGTPDLLITDNRGRGTGGAEYAAFLRTPRGLRYIGEIFGFLIRTLPLQPGQPSRLVTFARVGRSEMEIQLVELRSDGLHLLATAPLAAGDGGTAEGNRLLRELRDARTVSAETLRKVFGPSYDDLAKK